MLLLSNTSYAWRIESKEKVRNLDEELESPAINEMFRFVHTESSRSNYLYHLGKYLKWSNASTYDDLLKKDSDSIQKDLEDYLNWFQNDEGHGFRYVRLAIASLVAFFSANNKAINKFRLHRMAKPDPFLRKMIPYTTEDIRQILDSIDNTKLKTHPKYKYTKPRAKAMIHFLTASASRIGGMTDVKLEDLDKIKDCYFVKIYSNTPYEYTTFLTPEATKVVDHWIRITAPARNEAVSQSKKIKSVGDTLLFDMSHNTMVKTMQRIRNNAKLSYDSLEGKFSKPTNHAFRYRWNSIAKGTPDVDPMLVEFMMGHDLNKVSADVYRKIELDKLFSEFQKFSSKLQIFE